MLLIHAANLPPAIVKVKQISPEKSKKESNFKLEFEKRFQPQNAKMLQSSSGSPSLGRWNAVPGASWPHDSTTQVFNSKPIVKPATT